MFRNTFKAMNDWGDEFERRHFNGDFVGAVVNAPKKTAKAMSDWGDDFERRHFEGDFLGTVARVPVVAGEAISETISRVVEPTLDVVTGEPIISGFIPGDMPIDSSYDVTNAYHPSTSSAIPVAIAVPVNEPLSDTEKFPTETYGGSSSSTSPRLTSSHASEMEKPKDSTPDADEDLMFSLANLTVEELEERLEEERERRRGRAEALRSMTTAIRQLPLEIAQERRLVDEAEGARTAAMARLAAARRSLQTLRDNHSTVLERQEAQMEMHEQLIASAEASAAASTRAAQLARVGSPRAWARDGPETEALKEAKLVLAELLAQADEARLSRRKELNALQKEIEVCEAEQAWLKSGGYDHYQAPENSFRMSLQRLFSVAVGRKDPFDSPDSQKPRDES